MRRFLYLVSIFILGGIVYAPTLASSFFGYDDFWVVHRTAFEDMADPAGMLTTAHFGSAKYRPGARVLDYLAYRLGDGKPVWFRARNLAAHLGCAAMLYCLALLLFNVEAIAWAAALLFALHPLANQSTLAASWTVTPAAFLLLASLVLMMQAARSAHWMRWLVGAWLCLGVSLFIYEAGIVILGLWAAYVIFYRPPRRFVTVFALGTGAVLTVFFAARFLVVHASTEQVSVGSVVTNLVLFLGATASSLTDSILAHDVLGAPLPSEFDLGHPSSLMVPLVGTAVALVAAGLLAWQRIRKPAQFSEPFPGLKLAVILLSIPLWLVPFLLFTPHPSETYLYLPAASASLAMAAFVYYTVRPPAFVAIIALLALIFGVSTYNRNRHLIAGAAIAKHVLDGFPLEQWKQGNWDVLVAEAEPPLPRYGLYFYHGLATIGVAEAADHATEYALQLMTHNPHISARVLSPQQMASDACPQISQCFWVYADGRVIRTLGSTLAP